VFYLALSVAKIIALLRVNEIYANMEQCWNDTDKININSRRKACPSTTK